MPYLRKTHDAGWGGSSCVCSACCVNIASAIPHHNTGRFARDPCEIILLREGEGQTERNEIFCAFFCEEILEAKVSFSVRIVLPIWYLSVSVSHFCESFWREPEGKKLIKNKLSHSQTFLPSASTQVCAKLANYGVKLLHNWNVYFFVENFADIVPAKHGTIMWTFLESRRARIFGETLGLLYGECTINYILKYSREKSVARRRFAEWSFSPEHRQWRKHLGLLELFRSQLWNNLVVWCLENQNFLWHTEH